MGSRFCQFLAQETCCVALVLLCYLLRRSYGYDVAAAASTFGAEVYDVVSDFRSLLMSWKCSPVVGSSKMKSVGDVRSSER